MLKTLFLYVAIALLVSSSSCAGAQELEDALSQHPDPAKAAYYQENVSDILELRRLVSTGSLETRLQALDLLSIRYSDAAVTTAVTLINDEVPEIALAAAEILGASIAMSDHHSNLQEHIELNPYQRYIVERHTLAREALLASLSNQHNEVRDEAASILVSLSDQEAIRLINDFVQEGIYSDVEAVNYFGLADPDISAEYIIQYLEEGRVEARAAAVTYLGAIPDYRDRIRATFLDPSANELVRASAAQTLSRYDDTYETYALTAVLNPELPPSVYISLLEGYFDQIQSKGEMDLIQIEAIKDAIESFRASNPDVDLALIQARLAQFDQENLE